jgi:DeoR/GlpR family transcriptional regulator of sugar metabolism
MCFASILPDISLTVLTSGPNIALEVLKNHNPTVNLIGGLINQDNLCVSGKQSLNFIKDVNIDIAFMSSSGFSAKDGFTCGNYSEAELKKTIIKKANRVIMLMDSNKVDKSLIFTFASIKDIDIIITDSALPESIQSIISKTSTELIVV